MANKKISELPYINVSKISGNTLVPLVTYFSAATGDTVHTYVDDFQTYLISGLTGQTDVFVTGGTYSAGTITFTNNTGGTFSVTGVTFSGGSSVSGDYLPLSGGTVIGSTEFTAGLSANTISATTYLNLPITTDVFVTGGTYTNGDATFTNNTGGTFTVTGFYTGETSYVNSLTTGTGLSANTTTGDIIIINTDPDQVVVLNNGTNINVTGTYPNFTIDVTGLTDFNTFTTGFTYSSNTFTITDNSGSTFDATFTDVTGLTVNGDLNITGTTYSNVVSATTYQNLPISGLTEGNNINISGSNGNFTISVTGVTQGVSGDYLPLSGGTVTGNTIFTSGLTATTIGGSGYCVTDLFVSNIHSCSPLYLNPLNEGDIVFGSNSGFTYDITNSSSMTKGNVVGQSDSLSLYSLLSQANSLGLKGSLTLFSHTGATIEYVYNPNVSGYSSIIVGSNISNSKKFEIAYFGSSYVRSSPGNTGANFYQNKSVLRTGSDTNGVVINMDVNGPTSDLWFEQNGNSVMYLHSPGSTGYLGLALNTNGTEKPTSNLQIGGTGTTGTFKYVDGNQQNGYVLTSDASGNATWQLPTGGGTFTGGTVSGSTQFTNGLSANTISATTLTVNGVNITGDTYVTGLTFNTSNYNLTIGRNDGVSFTDSLSILASDLTVTGGTYNPNNGTATFTNNTGGTFNVTGFLTGLTDTFVTGGTYSNGTATFTNTSGGTFNVTGFYTGGTDVFVTGGTYSAGTITFTNNTGGTFNVTGLTTGSTSTISGEYLPLSGGTVTGGTVFQSGLTANTISETTYIDFTTGSTNPSAIGGRLFFDNTQKALSYYDISGNNVPIAMGQQLYVRVWNETGVQIDKGKVISITGTSNNLPSAILSVNSPSTTADRPIGVSSENIPNNTEGLVLVNGILSGLTINSFSNGDTLYLSDVTPGEYVNSTTSLAFSSRTNEIGYVIQTGTTTGKIYVNINNEDSNLSLTDIERNILEGNVISTGCYEFSGITQGTGNTINVALVRGWVVRNTNQYSTLPEVDNIQYTGETNITLTNITSADVTYILLNSGATLVQQTTYPTPQERRENIFLGKVTHPDRVNILDILQTVDFDVSPMSALRDLWTPIKLINEDVLVSANGVNMNINTSAGTLWGYGIGWTTNELNPNSVSISGTSPTTFQYRTQLGVITGGTVPSGNTTTIYPDYYDVNGVVTAVGGGANASTNQRVYLYPNGNIRIQLGQQVYTSLAAAVTGALTEQFSEFSNIRDNAILIGIISLNKNASVGNGGLVNTTYAVFNYVSKFGEVLGGTGGISTTTLQQAYNNSTNPEITTNSTLGGVQFRGGTGSDTDKNIIIENNAGTETAYVRANGQAFFESLTANTISATTYQNLPDNVTGNYLPLSGGTVSGNTTITANLTVSGNSGINWFSSNTSSDLVRITQTGLGNAFVVEDNTNPDSTPFIINSGGSVSVGTTSVFSVGVGGAETKLNVSNGSSGVATTGLPISTVFLAESTIGTSIGLLSPDAAISQIYFGTPSDTFGSFLRWDYTNRNLILATANSTGKLIFQTANAVEVARIDQSGNMGIGLTGATQKLEVSGNTRIYGSMSADTISATTYQNLPDNVTGRYLPLSGGTVTGNTIFTSGLTANTLNVTGNTNVKAFTGTTGYISGSGQNILTVIGSGNSTTSPLFSVQGSSGELFSVTDSLVGSLFSVNDISGLPIMEVFSDNTTLWGSYQSPSLNTTTRTSLTAGTNTIYSIPTSAYTGAFYEYTLISSGTTGARAGQIMSIWSGTTANFTETSTTDIGTTTGVTFTVAVSGNNAVLSSSATTAGWTVKTIIRSI